MLPFFVGRGILLIEIFKHVTNEILKLMNTENNDYFVQKFIFCSHVVNVRYRFGP